MKKVLIWMVMVLLFISMAACSKAPAKETENGTTENPIQMTESTTAEATTESTPKPPVDLGSWGVEEKVTTIREENVDRYIIRLPRYTGSTYAHSKISEQLDDTVVLVAGEYIGKPPVENTADIFSAYKEYTLESMEDLYGVQSSNFEMTIDSSEAVTIGDYEMYTHKGVITYDFDGARRQHQYVAYTTKLKDSGNCAYWMVYDFSADQSKGDLIAEHALNMAKTFREEQ